MPTPARESAAVFDHDGHSFSCALEFFVHEDPRDHTTLHADAQWRISMDGAHVSDYPAYVGETTDDVRRRLTRVYELQRELGMR